MMEEFARQFNSIFTENGVVNFSIDILEKENGYMVLADLVGYSKENISISYEDDYLNIQVKEMETPKDLKFVLKERNLGAKKRSIYLPEINPETISAKFENGILSINMQNKEPNVKTIEIE